MAVDAALNGDLNTLNMLLHLGVMQIGIVGACLIIPVKLLPVRIITLPSSGFRARFSPR